MSVPVVRLSIPPSLPTERLGKRWSLEAPLPIAMAPEGGVVTLIVTLNEADRPHLCEQTLHPCSARTGKRYKLALRRDDGGEPYFLLTDLVQCAACRRALASGACSLHIEFRTKDGSGAPGPAYLHLRGQHWGIVPGIREDKRNHVAGKSWWTALERSGNEEPRTLRGYRSELADPLGSELRARLRGVTELSESEAPDAIVFASTPPSDDAQAGLYVLVCDRHNALPLGNLHLSVVEFERSKDLASDATSLALLARECLLLGRSEPLASGYCQLDVDLAGAVHRVALERGDYSRVRVYGAASRLTVWRPVLPQLAHWEQLIAGGASGCLVCTTSRVWDALVSHYVRNGQVECLRVEPGTLDDDWSSKLQNVRARLRLTLDRPQSSETVRRLMARRGRAGRAVIIPVDAARFQLARAGDALRDAQSIANEYDLVALWDSGATSP